MYKFNTMKKILLALPLSLLLFACNNDDDYIVENNLIESTDPSLESTDAEGTGREKEIVFCGNRWDCTKVAPKKDTVLTIPNNKILNVK